MKTIYIVYVCDAAPYSDIQDFARKAFVSKERAVMYADILSKQSRKGVDKDRYTDYYYRVEELLLEE